MPARNGEVDEGEDSLMGCATEAYCVTCRKRWYCGYGSYGRNEERAAISPYKAHKDLGHEVGWTMPGECTYQEGNDLHMDDYMVNDGESTLMIKDYYLFDDIPLTHEKTV